MRSLLTLLALLILLSTLQAQTARPWKGKKTAVVLTYDDALDQQLDNAAPLLDSLGLKATFYVTAYAHSVQQRLNDWRDLDRRGHELGNHTLFHPCLADMPGREFVPVDYKLNHYTIQRMTDETRMTNLFLQALDGKTERTFAFTCGDMRIGDSSFIQGMKKDFMAARAVRHEMHTLNEVDLYNVDCYMVNSNSFLDMKQWVDQAISNNKLLVILFHGVGGGSGLDVSLTAHRELLQYIKQKEDEIWVAPMVEVAKYIQEQQRQ